MSDNVGSYTDKKGRLVIYNRSDGGGSVSIEKDDVAEVILWLASFQQSVQLTAFGVGMLAFLAGFGICWLAFVR